MNCGLLYTGGMSNHMYDKKCTNQSMLFSEELIFHMSSAVSSNMYMHAKYRRCCKWNYCGT